MKNKLKKYALISNEKVQLIAKLAYIPCPGVTGQVMKLTQGFQFNLFFSPLYRQTPGFGPLERHLYLREGVISRMAHFIQQ